MEDFKIGKSEQLAKDFINKYPLMFNEDKDFWTEKLTELLKEYGKFIADSYDDIQK